MKTLRLRVSGPRSQSWRDWGSPNAVLPAVCVTPVSTFSSFFFKSELSSKTCPPVKQAYGAQPVLESVISSPPCLQMENRCYLGKLESRKCRPQPLGVLEHSLMDVVSDPCKPDVQTQDSHLELCLCIPRALPVARCAWAELTPWAPGSRGRRMRP